MADGPVCAGAAPAGAPAPGQPAGLPRGVAAAVQQLLQWTEERLQQQAAADKPAGRETLPAVEDT